MEKNDDKLAERQFRTMLMVYPVLVGALQEWQRRQWHVVYYAFLLLGGIAFMHKAWRASAASLLCGFVGFTALLAIVLLQNSVVKARRDINKYRCDYQPEFKPLKYNKNYARWYRDLAMLKLHVIALVLGIMFTYLFISR